MKKCNDCNVYMVDFNGKKRSNIECNDEENSELIYYNYDTKDFLTPWDYVKARVCPSCGKLELYVDVKEAKLDKIEKGN